MNEPQRVYRESIQKGEVVLYYKITDMTDMRTHRLMEEILEQLKELNNKLSHREIHMPKELGEQTDKRLLDRLIHPRYITTGIDVDDKCMFDTEIVNNDLIDEDIKKHVGVCVDKDVVTESEKEDLGYEEEYELHRRHQKWLVNKERFRGGMTWPKPYPEVGV